jgi:phosphatidylserine/phosphatidylglycerophosphate/cardiolipin synthase-like enzyme
LAEAALLLVDCCAIEAVCQALRHGDLTRDSTATARRNIAKGNAALESALQVLARIWASSAELSPGALETVLRTTADAVGIVQREVAVPQIVWTGPNVTGSFVRATQEVLREMIRQARRDLIFVGYWIAASHDGGGITQEIIDLLGDAAARGVRVQLVVDERSRSSGPDNRATLRRCWPGSVPMPTLLTWKLPPDDHHLKLHAKVLVVDHEDALVTSANLTSYALNHNMEMGVRVYGRCALHIARHFSLLVSAAVLEPYLE